MRDVQLLAQLEHVERIAKGVRQPGLSGARRHSGVMVHQAITNGGIAGISAPSRPL